jgi:hypothetical protein
MITNNQSAYPTLITASTIIKPSGGQLLGIFVSSASATPQITIYDGTSASGTKIVELFVPVGATFYSIPATTTNGIYVVIGGTVSATVLWT